MRIYLSAQTFNEVKRHLSEGRKISAIKVVRDTSKGESIKPDLQGAKLIVEACQRKGDDYLETGYVELQI